jgi:hypothetical protein
MGIFGRLFTKPKTIDELMSKFISDFFQLHGIQSLTDGEIFRAYLNACAITSGMLNHFSTTSFRGKIDELVESTQNRTRNLNLLVEDAVIDPNAMPEFLVGFTTGHGVNRKTTVNGYAAFLAFYETRFMNLLRDIMSTDDDMMGQYPIVKLQIEVFGEERARKIASKKIEVMFNAPKLYMTFIKDIIDAKSH